MSKNSSNQEQKDSIKVYNAKEILNSDENLLSKNSIQNLDVDKASNSKKDNEEEEFPLNISLFKKKKWEKNINELGKMLKRLNLPESKYEYIFDEEYIKYFSKGVNLDNFSEVMDEIRRNYYDEFNSDAYGHLVDKKMLLFFDKTIIQMYINLTKLYEEFEKENYLSKKNFFDFLEIYGSDIETKSQQIFDLYTKVKGRVFLNIFFQNISPKLFRFFILIYMKRIQINIIMKGKEIPLSIINEQNEIGKYIITNIINIITSNTYELDKKYKDEDILETIYLLLDYYIFFEETFSVQINSNLDLDYKIKGIFNKYKVYYHGLSVLNKNNNYSYILEFVYDDDKFIFYPNKIWNKYIKNEYKTYSLKILINSLNEIDKLSNFMERNINKEQKFYRKKFFDIIFEKLSENLIVYIQDFETIENETNSLEKIIKFINGVVKLILYEGNNKNNIFKIYMKCEEKNEDKARKEIFEKIIKNIISFLEKVTFKNLDDDLKMEFINSLIILLESFGEYKNNYFYEIMFTNIEKNFELKSSLFGRLVVIYNNFRASEMEKERPSCNKLIIFNSLTNCIIEYLVGCIKFNYAKFGDEVHKLLIVKLNAEHLSQSLGKDITYYNYFKYNNYLLLDIELFKNISFQNLKDIDFKLNNYFINILLNINTAFETFLKKLIISFDYNAKSNSIELKNEEIKDDTFNISENNNMNDLVNIKKGWDEIIDDNIPNISNSVNELINKYKKNELFSDAEAKNIFELIFLEYKMIFHLIKFDSLNEFDCLLSINDTDRNFKNSKELIDFLYYKNNKKKYYLIILFSFMQKICDIIELRNEEQKIIEYEIILLLPDYLDLSIHSMNYFENQIDYSERETKIMSIYNLIECLIYDIKYQSRSFKNFLGSMFGHEIFNILLLLIYNVLLTIYYKKPLNESDEKYNNIDNRNDFLSIKIITILHILYLVIIIINWSISRMKIEYFYCRTKFSNDYFKENEKLKMGQKAKLLKNFDFDFDVFFPKRNEEKITKYFNGNCFQRTMKSLEYYFGLFNVYVNTFETISPFIISLICLLLSFWSQIFLVIPLLLIFNIFPHLKAVYLIIKEQLITLVLLGIYILLILYVFSWFGFFFLPKMFKYEAVDKKNELVSLTEESICSSSVSCILYFMNYGLSSEGAIEMNLISFKYSVSYYLIQFFFEIFLYLFIHMIFFNVVLATISNTFDEMKKKVEQKKYDEKNVCFICGKTRIDSINDSKDFDKHLKIHDKWKYIIYMIQIILKNKEEYTNEEYNIWRQIKKKKLNWLPKYDKESNDN